MQLILINLITINEYTYQACNPGVKEQIVDMAINNSGVRDIAES
ncbi:transposase [Xenorhabdus hominickii]|uniref:Transposase n=1 Tax=Xenorhabdus hominickii TaxID=351679 RepID=A0A2G0Q9U3_XENHO|nr:transposase [Xenorhabdus hominickii]